MTRTRRRDGNRSARRDRRFQPPHDRMITKLSLYDNRGIGALCVPRQSGDFTPKTIHKTPRSGNPSPGIRRPSRAVSRHGPLIVPERVPAPYPSAPPMEAHRPNFFIIGAPKCGTTSLYTHLAQHPDVFLPPLAYEPNYFIRNEPIATKFTIRDREEYLRQFASAGDARRIGERSVSYLYSESAAREIASLGDDVRALVMLRHPVEQMHSLHWVCVQSLNDDLLDFREALDAEADRAAGRRIPASAGRPFILRYRHIASTAAPLAAWMTILGRERLHVEILDDYAADPAGRFAEVCRFLDISPEAAVDFSRQNEAPVAAGLGMRRFLAANPWVRSLARSVLPQSARKSIAGSAIKMTARKRTPLDPSLRAELLREMEPEIAALESLLDRDLSLWRRTS